METGGTIGCTLFLGTLILGGLLIVELMGLCGFLETGEVPYLTGLFLYFIHGVSRKVNDAWKSITLRRSKELPPLLWEDIPRHHGLALFPLMMAWGVVAFFSTGHLMTVWVGRNDISHLFNTWMAIFIPVFAAPILAYVARYRFWHRVLNNQGAWWSVSKDGKTVERAPDGWYGPWKARRLVYVEPVMIYEDQGSLTIPGVIGHMRLGFALSPFPASPELVHEYLERYRRFAALSSSGGISTRGADATLFTPFVIPSHRLREYEEERLTVSRLPPREVVVLSFS